MAARDNYLGYMTADLRQYVGEMIAICDGKVVSHDPSSKKAYAEAKTLCPIRRPLLTRVPDQDTMIFRRTSSHEFQVQGAASEEWPAQEDPHHSCDVHRPFGRH